MAPSPATTFASTKLIVHDLEKMAAFYSEAYGFDQTGRVQAELAGEPIDEIFLGKSGESGGGLILMKYVDRPAAENGEVLLVFTTHDIDARFDRVRAAGGASYVEPVQSDVVPYKAGFTTDPEGHLIENVELPS